MVDMIKEKYDTLEDKIIMIGCGDNEKDFEALKNEIESNIKAKKFI